MDHLEYDQYKDEKREAQLASARNTAMLTRNFPGFTGPSPRRLPLTAMGAAPIVTRHGCATGEYYVGTIDR